jgi:3-oxoacyl-[acyl-carrier-protein] synthase-3
LTLQPRVSVRAKISSIGTYVPPRVLTNADLEKLVETNDEWIVERTGIRERHIVDEGVATSDLAAEAARQCLARRGIEASEVEAIIVATVTPDMLFPATACLVQEKIGAKGAWGFDLSAACSGFPYALQVGAKLVESGAHRRVLFGDGAGAVLLEPCAEGEIGLVDFFHEIDGAGARSLYMPGGGSLHPSTAETVAKNMHVVHQDGQAVYKFAVRKMAEATGGLLKRHGVEGKDLACFIPHQANKRIILSTAERLGLPLDRVIINIDRYGNTTAATIPLAMQTAIEDGCLKKGGLVLLASVGAGFTVGATLLQWEF